MDHIEANIFLVCEIVGLSGRPNIDWLPQLLDVASHGVSSAWRRAWDDNRMGLIEASWENHERTKSQVLPSASEIPIVNKARGCLGVQVRFYTLVHSNSS